ncbi:MAG: tRNA uridine-5-carboxymethylaminomethyl(34) synthesis enzyme MnmG [candidate division WOR-3 bacterium]
MVKFIVMYDVIVVGGGHAGIEASLVSARLGMKTLLFTMQKDMIGQMSCNPAIGGLAKGHLVLEVDAMGGQIGQLADATAIQYRMLNIGKGPAVWSPRTQNDRIEYKKEAQKILMREPNIEIEEDEVKELLRDGNRVAGIKTQKDKEYFARAVILTTGTFLKGLIHIGLDSFNGGRLGEKESSNLSDSLQNIGLFLGRLKTGTSPRIDGKTIDFSELKIQPGDENPFPFSFRTEKINIEQIPCHITHTSLRTHRIIEESLSRSPLFSGKIKGIGPRYCPSIEDKVFRFKDRPTHPIFLEPEGRNTNEYYINGLSTSLPFDVQVAMVNSIKGLERAEILRPGYAVEYDYVLPTQLRHNLETKLIQNLFLAGQINGTSGYEEAAAQGFMAGVNAVLKIRGEEPFVLKRSEAYIGVLIDDLVLKGTEEPYRMFTSRAEHRLLLRIDNVLERLMPYGRRFGLISEREFNEQKEQWLMVEEEIRRLGQTRLDPARINPILEAIGETPVDQHLPLATILKRPKVRYEDITRMDGKGSLPPDLSRKVEIRIKYEGYIRRDEELAKKFSEMEARKIPPWVDFNKVPGLSNEARAKLSKIQPANLGQASRISGITPSDVIVLFFFIE